ELDGQVFVAADPVDRAGESGGPAAGLAAEDRLQGLALTLARALVDEHAHHRFRLARPYVALERGDGGDVQPVERDVAVVALLHVPREDSVALPFVGRLGE